ncbi:hypothetical protein [Nocardia arthritidis]|uniref:PE domain-containing protein n=1 Tax=Nocardia arthritidis TaxID=228602 RepID=A0A6G9YKD3_9NOCA|nr:hypothetical protein [Nocardia arthritidis]QIS13648.1 hypothetical protein F5544_29015 [Nocardia arthritidis]
MPDNRHEPILPIPADLYRQTGRLYDRIIEFRDELNRIRSGHFDLADSPQSLAVDDLGEPIRPIDANSAALDALDKAEDQLGQVERAVDEARRFSGRLKLTDQADQQREGRLARQRRTERTR